MVSIFITIKYIIIFFNNLDYSNFNILKLQISPHTIILHLLFSLLLNANQPIVTIEEAPVKGQGVKHSGNDEKAKQY